MTDLIPNDLSHMSDEDFNALCPQGHHAPGPEPLSPAAQTVLDAFAADNYGVWLEGDPDRIAAALRALAERINGADAIRQDVLDIADELGDQ